MEFWQGRSGKGRRDSLSLSIDRISRQRKAIKQTPMQCKLEIDSAFQCLLFFSCLALILIDCMAPIWSDLEARSHAVLNWLINVMQTNERERERVISSARLAQQRNAHDSLVLYFFLIERERAGKAHKIVLRAIVNHRLPNECMRAHKHTHTPTYRRWCKLRSNLKYATSKKFLFSFSASFRLWNEIYEKKNLDFF